MGQKVVKEPARRRVSVSCFSRGPTDNIASLSPFFFNGLGGPFCVLAAAFQAPYKHFCSVPPFDIPTEDNIKQHHIRTSDK